MVKPLVSVVVPNYNHARFLGERLESIFSQTFQNFEVILLDDCSSDDSVSILREFSARSQMSHFVVNEQNSGSPCSQWRAGVERAQGRYVWLAESDDAAEPDFLATLVTRLEADPTSVVACSGSKWINEHGVPLPEDGDWLAALDPDRWQRDFTSAGAAEVRDYLGFRNTIVNASAAVFRTAVARRIAWPLKFRYCGDWVFWSRMLPEGSFHYCSRELNRFRAHSASTRAAGSASRAAARCVEFLQAVSDIAGRFRGFTRPGNRDHTWVTKAWLNEHYAVPWFVLGEQKLRPSIRSSFILSAIAIGGPQLFAPRIGLGRWWRRLSASGLPR